MSPAQWPPRVEHLVVLEGPGLEYIGIALDLPSLAWSRIYRYSSGSSSSVSAALSSHQSRIVGLIQLGAIFYAIVCPKPPPCATSEQIRIIEEVTATLVLRNRASIRGNNMRSTENF
ncbi:hypothetical protein CMV_006545 [Castanea mollissima]|uniref:Uncharacterized protein n=1 Tax=Castanea mollissima TaxID=60419 RepID=A0A8J4RJL4_9ROSI|nr:hypothetical protein CMV_006545 [Castanea mollissima]